MHNLITILICEDNRTEELMLQASLRDFDHVKFERFTTKQGLVNALKGGSQPDILITDLVLPDAEGMEILDAIEPYKKNFATIVISGQGEFDIISQIQARGYLFYLIKNSGAISNLHQLVDLIIRSRLFNRKQAIKA